MVCKNRQKAFRNLGKIVEYVNRKENELDIICKFDIMKLYFILWNWVLYGETVGYEKSYESMVNVRKFAKSNETRGAGGACTLSGMGNFVGAGDIDTHRCRYLSGIWLWYYKVVFGRWYVIVWIRSLQRSFDRIQCVTVEGVRLESVADFIKEGLQV